jgi:signal transduction histidine kinase
VRHRLYLQIYLSVVGVALVVVLLVALVGRAVWLNDRLPQNLERSAERLAAHVEANGANDLPERARSLGVRARLRGPGETSETFPHRPGSGASRFHRVPAASVALSDGRWLQVRPGPRGRRPSPAAGFLVLGLAIAAGAYPVSRRITRRLERLRDGVDRLGEGDLSARVPVEGRDEVAELARSLNSSADRIEALVAAQRRIMAGASHELRTPLARLRVASELLAGTSGRKDLLADVETSIEELDELIEELLLAARLDAGVEVPVEPVDVAALLRREAGSLALRIEGTIAPLPGNPRELRRLVRNLLDNARRYGGESVELELSEHEGALRLRVLDRGPGVPEAFRERIFEPYFRAPDRPASDRGVGLGLALTRDIARRHGGSIRYGPREGGGSCFEVTLRGRLPADS